MVSIVESGMNFGPFLQEDVFYIEKSSLYKNIGDKVQIAEFVLKKNGALIFIEAKSSVPNPTGINPERFPEYIDEISAKLHNSLELLFSAKLNIAQDEEGEAQYFISNGDIEKMKIVFRLVIKNADKEWLLNIQNALQDRLIAAMNIWNIDVSVLNEEMARIRKLVS